MQQKPEKWMGEISKFCLSGGISLILFYLVSSLLGFLFSYLGGIFGYKSAILMWGRDTTLIATILITFILVSSCLLIAEFFVYKRIALIQKRIPPVWLAGSSVLFFLITGLLFYFIFSYTLSSIHNLFWS